MVNPAIEEQAIDQVHRMNEPSILSIDEYQGTIEEKVREFQKEKKDTFEEIVGDIEKPTGCLSILKI